MNLITIISYVKYIFSDSTPFTYSGEWELGMCDQQMEVFSNLLFLNSSNGVNKKKNSFGKNNKPRKQTREASWRFLTCKGHWMVLVSDCIVGPLKEGRTIHVLQFNRTPTKSYTKY